MTHCLLKSFCLTEKEDAFRGREEAGSEGCPMPQCFPRGEDPFERLTSFAGKLGEWEESRKRLNGPHYSNFHLEKINIYVGWR